MTRKGQQLTTPSTCPKCGDERASKARKDGTSRWVCRTCAHRRSVANFSSIKKDPARYAAWLARKKQVRHAKGVLPRAEIMADALRKRVFADILKAYTQAAGLHPNGTPRGGRFPVPAEAQNDQAAMYRYRYWHYPEFRKEQRERAARYKDANPHVAARYGDLRRVRAALQSDGTITRPALSRLFRQAKDCPYCGVILKDAAPVLDHAEPISKGGLHGIANVIVCCKPCNRRKKAMRFTAWLGRIGRERSSVTMSRLPLGRGVMARDVGIVATDAEIGAAISASPAGPRLTGQAAWEANQERMRKPEWREQCRVWREQAAARHKAA